MKKVLLVTLATGGGHNYAAASLETRLREAGLETVRLDPFREGDRALDLLISSGYETLARRSPALFGQIYRTSDVDPINENAIRLIKRKCERRLLARIRAEGPDLLVSTHPILTFILGDLRRENRLSVPLMAVITDYRGHHTYTARHPEVDAYITGSLHTTRDLVRRGVPEHKIFAYGIPIRPEFHQPPGPADRDRRFTILLMGGSMGARLMEQVLRHLVRMPESLRILAVCGRDRVLEQRLSRRTAAGDTGEGKEITVYGFTGEIARLMDQSDLMISKPGGLTVSEAIARRMPLLIPYFIPGQEEENAEFLEEAGAALRVKEIGNVPSVVRMLMHHPVYLESMRRNMEALARTHSIEAVVRTACILAGAAPPPDPAPDPEPAPAGPADVILFYNGYSRRNRDLAGLLGEQLEAAGIPVVSLDFFREAGTPGPRWAPLRMGPGMQGLLRNLHQARPARMDVFFGRIFSPALARSLQRHAPRVVVSCFPDLGIVLAHHRARMPGPPRVVQLFPGIPPARSWVAGAADAYLVPDEGARRSLAAQGVPAEAVHPSCFPVRGPESGPRDAPAEAPPGGAPVLLILADGDTVLPRRRSFYTWLDGSGWETVVLLGSHRPIRRLIRGFAHIAGVRPARDPSDLFEMADLVLAAPGSLVAYEALHHRVPIVAYRGDPRGVPDPMQGLYRFPGSEEGLRAFLEEYRTRPELRRAAREQLRQVQEACREQSGLAAIVARMLREDRAGARGAGPERKEG